MADAVAMSEELARRMLRVVTYVERLMGTSYLSDDVSSSVEPVWFKTTSATADNQGHYPGVPTLFSAPDNAWVEYETAKLAVPNGETLSNATRYPARPSGSRTSDGAEVYTMLSAASVTGGAITVKESDASPTISGVTSVAFDSEGSGTWETGPGAFLVSGSSPNAAVTSRLRLASASASGIVRGPGGARQHFGGDYAFDLSVDFVGDTTFGAIMAINGTVDYGDSVPAHNGSGGHNGQFACDGTYLYFKDSNFGWGRVALNFSF